MVVSIILTIRSKSPEPVGPDEMQQTQQDQQGGKGQQQGQPQGQPAKK